MQIHGTKDKFFPINNFNNIIKIENGSHFMIVNKAAQISNLLNAIIKN